MTTSETIPTTVITFRYVNAAKDTLDYVEVVLVGKLDPDCIEHRQIAYERLAEQIGDQEVQYCVISNWKTYEVES
jgi:hypothetical protein